MSPPACGFDGPRSQNWLLQKRTPISQAIHRKNVFLSFRGQLGEIRAPMGYTVVTRPKRPTFFELFSLFPTPFDISLNPEKAHRASSLPNPLDLHVHSEMRPKLRLYSSQRDLSTLASDRSVRPGYSSTSSYESGAFK